MKKILIGCECSQVVTLAFRQLGYRAYSCDIQDCYGGYPQYHIKGDLFSVVDPSDFDLVILHPPCTYLTRLNNVRYSDGIPFHLLDNFNSARSFFFRCLSFPARFLAVENPIPHPLAKLPRYSFRIQPYEFGHPFSKCTCFWIKNLPCLLPTCHVLNHTCWVESSGGYSKQFDTGKYTKQRKRSQTFPGVAAAIARQWGDFVERSLSHS